MKSTVYIETSVVSYLTSRTNSDLITAAHQKATQDWWAERSQDFALFISEFVLGEAQGGDPEAARRRVAVLADIPSLELFPQIETLATELLSSGAVPAKTRLDALHIATASVHGIHYLLTWNFRHIANAEKWAAIESVCQSMGVKMPRICSPLELMQNT